MNEYSEIFSSLTNGVFRTCAFDFILFARQADEFDNKNDLRHSVVRRCFARPKLLRAMQVKLRGAARIQKGVQDRKRVPPLMGSGGSTGHLPMPRSLWSGSACNRYPIPRSSRAMPWNGAIFHLAHISRSNSRAASHPTTTCPTPSDPNSIALYSRTFVKHPRDHADRWHNAVTASRFGVPVYIFLRSSRYRYPRVFLAVPKDRSPHNQPIFHAFYWNLIVGNYNC